MRKRGPAPKVSAPSGYVRFTQATELFKPFEKNAFNYRVRMGDIKANKDEQGRMYEIASIIKTRDILLKAQEDAKKLPVPITVDWLYPEDIPAVLALDQIVYREIFLAEAEVYMAWRRKNPHISKAAFDAKDRRTCYGYVGLIPLPESVIIDILTGKRDEKEIIPDDILTYDEPGEYTLLANSAVVHPDHPEMLNDIIRAIVDYWYEQYPARRISRIYAQTVSEQGRTLARKLYLGPLYMMQDHGVARIEDAYVLDMHDRAVSKIIQRFQDRLQSKQQNSPSR